MQQQRPGRTELHLRPLLRLRLLLLDWQCLRCWSCCSTGQLLQLLLVVHCQIGRMCRQTRPCACCNSIAGRSVQQLLVQVLLLLLQCCYARCCCCSSSCASSQLLQKLNMLRLHQHRDELR
jgi:hypothetical protein